MAIPHIMPIGFVDGITKDGVPLPEDRRVSQQHQAGAGENLC